MAAVPTQMPDCISTNEVKEFFNHKKQEIAQRESQTVFPTHNMKNKVQLYLSKGDDNLKERFDEKELVKGNYVSWLRQTDRQTDRQCHLLSCPGQLKMVKNGQKMVK